MSTWKQTMHLQNCNAKMLVTYAVLQLGPEFQYGCSQESSYISYMAEGIAHSQMQFMCLPLMLMKSTARTLLTCWHNYSVCIGKQSCRNEKMALVHVHDFKAQALKHVLESSIEFLYHQMMVSQTCCMLQNIFTTFLSSCGVLNVRGNSREVQKIYAYEVAFAKIVHVCR